MFAPIFSLCTPFINKCIIVLREIIFSQYKIQVCGVKHAEKREKKMMGLKNISE